MSQLIACPECKKHLQVPEELLGKKVQCPECKHTFTAAVAEQEVTSKTGTTASTPAPSKTAEWDKKTSSVTGKKRKKDDDDDDYEVEDRDDKDRDDDDDDDRRRRRKRRRSSSASSRGHYMPHRGGMILAFGIIGLVGWFIGFWGICTIFSVIAWTMGNSDLAEIRAGRMDPEGEGLTQAGRICGMIATILSIVSIVLVCGFFGCLFGLGIFGAAAQQGGPGRRR